MRVEYSCGAPDPQAWHRGSAKRSTRAYSAYIQCIHTCTLGMYVESAMKGPMYLILSGYEYRVHVEYIAKTLIRY